jgi:hypothetical protein
MGGLPTKMRMAPKRSAMSATRIGVSAKQAKFHQQTYEFGHGKQAEFLNDTKSGVASGPDQSSQRIPIKDAMDPSMDPFRREANSVS